MAARDYRFGQKPALDLVRDIGAVDGVESVSLELRGRHWMARACKGSAAAATFCHDSDRFADPRDALAQLVARAKLGVSIVVPE